VAAPPIHIIPPPPSVLSQPPDSITNTATPATSATAKTSAVNRNEGPDAYTRKTTEQADEGEEEQASLFASLSLCLGFFFSNSYDLINVKRKTMCSFDLRENASVFSSQLLCCNNQCMHRVT
jgi:hypothetical protein